MKKILTLLSLTLAGGALVLGSAISTAPKKVNEAKADAPTYTTYVNLTDGWIEHTDGSASKTVGELLRGRNDRFWSGNSDPNNWDSQERTFNGMDSFIDTIHKAGGEGWRGNYRTPELELHDEDHRYISFLFGGGETDIFVNVWHVRYANGSEVFPEGYNRNVIEGERPFFDGSGTFDNKEAKINAPRTCNMTFRYYRLPDSISVGDKYLIFVRDGKQSGYGGFTFGDVHVNQTLEDCARSFSAHKAQMKINEFTSDWNRNANESVLNFYANDSYYAAVRTVEAALTDANDGFEINNRLSKWCYDQPNSTYENGDLAGINFDYIYSDKEWKWGGHFYDNDGMMPTNKTGNLFLTGEPDDMDGPNCGLPESAKYRLISHEFTLSGTGLISAKIGGHYAKLSLLDSNFNVLLSTGNNPSFVDADMTNFVTSGARMCTMTRTYLDCSAYLNQRVHIAIEDSQTGGGWNLAYFDEIVTKYDSLPGFKLDVVHQNKRNNDVYNGVIKDKLVVGETYIAAFKEAYDFLQTYYSTVRVEGKNFSFCSDRISEKEALETSYNGLSATAKTVVDASEDFHYGNEVGYYDGAYYLATVVKSFTVGQSMTAILTGVYPSSVQLLTGLDNKVVTSTSVIIIISVAFVGLIVGFTFVKRRKHN